MSNGTFIVVLNYHLLYMTDFADEVRVRAAASLSLLVLLLLNLVFVNLLPQTYPILRVTRREVRRLVVACLARRRGQRKQKSLNSVGPRRALVLRVGVRDTAGPAPAAQAPEAAFNEKQLKVKRRRNKRTDPPGQAPSVHNFIDASVEQDATRLEDISQVDEQVI